MTGCLPDCAAARPPPPLPSPAAPPLPSSSMVTEEELDDGMRMAGRRRGASEARAGRWSRFPERPPHQSLSTPWSSGYDPPKAASAASASFCDYLSIGDRGRDTYVRSLSCESICQSRLGIPHFSETVTPRSSSSPPPSRSVRPCEKCYNVMWEGEKERNENVRRASERRLRLGRRLPSCPPPPLLFLPPRLPLLTPLLLFSLRCPWSGGGSSWTV